jgi:polar amino acid transport system substrate-binding protein
MKLTRRMTLVASAFAMFAGIAQAQDEVRIGIAAEPYPPFASPDAAGNWTGWEIEIINAICAAGSLNCVITPVAWDGIIPSLTGNQIDVIMASMSITEERMQTIDFTDRYYKTPASIVAAIGSGITADAAGLEGKILGVQASTTHQDYAQTHFASADIRIYQTQDEANQDLVAGRLDAFQADSTAAADFVTTEAGACCEVVGNVEDDVAILGQGVGAGVRKGEDALRETLNAAIAQIIADGTHAEITSRYFSAPIL